MNKKNMIEEGSKRLAICWECKNFWWGFPLRPSILNGCIKGKPIPNSEPAKSCTEFKAIKTIDKQKKP